MTVTHGEAGHGRETPEWRCWRGMRERCIHPQHRQYSDYGGRGITICDAWLHSYEQFLADVGRKPTPAHSIDRIDVNGNYEPGNVRWSTSGEQQRNTRSNRLETYNGETLCLADWADRTGIRSGTILARLNRGWSVERSLTIPPLPANGHETRARKRALLKP